MFFFIFSGYIIQINDKKYVNILGSINESVS